jgi:hypothetical protein
VIKPRASFRRVSFALTANLLILLLASCALELVLRARYYHSLDFSMEMWKYSVQLKRPSADPRLSFEHRPSSRAHLMGVDVSINSDGQRDRSFPREKPAGAFRILMLGDSTTFGWGVKLEDTIPKLLEAELNRVGEKRYEVINASVGNYTTVQEVEYYLTQGVGFHPDMVILDYFINDAEPVPKEKKGFLIDSSYVVAFLKSRFDTAMRTMGLRADWRSYYASLYNDGMLGWVQAQAMLHQLATRCHTDGTLLLVALLPELREINDRYPFTEAHAKVKATLAIDGVDALELIDGLRGVRPESRLWVTPHDTHPNREANLLIASQLRERVMSTLRGQ